MPSSIPRHPTLLAVEAGKSCRPADWSLWEASINNGNTMTDDRIGDSACKVRGTWTS